jgi:acyl-CoA thioesterase FadM
VFAPVVQLRVDYLAPAQMCDQLDVTARLFKSDAVKLEFEYEIRRLEERILLARGGTVQVFTSRAGELLLAWPAFMVERFEAWKDLWIQPSAAA